MPDHDDVAGLVLQGGAESACQQMQIVIAQHHHRIVAERTDQPQALQRLGPAIHQIAHEP